MTSTSVHRRRGLGARIVPFLIALGALPLMAPTCGSSGEGFKIFARRSLIIPIEVCYQNATDYRTVWNETTHRWDTIWQTYSPAGGGTECPSPAAGDPIKAYGLVYQLVRNGIAVYWVIDGQKTSATAVDLTIQYDGGVPVYLFDWSTGREGAAPSIGNGGHLINYRGGPFVVDGSDFDRASAVLQSYRSTFGPVNVHVSNVAFRGYSKRTMAGGWSAGGNAPPKLALLDVGSDGSGAKNSEVVIQGYLSRAGLDTTGAMGYADPSQGPHGSIFDRLFLPDFLGADWRTSRLATNGYQILWVPHWDAPSSCSDCPPSTSCTCQTKYPEASVAQALKNIGSFVTDTAGGRVPGDLFAECTGLGSFEGVFSSRDPSGYSPTFVLPSQLSAGGEPSTHFETIANGAAKTGFWINQSVDSALLDPTGKGVTVFASPLMQIGDFTFVPKKGALQNFQTQTYRPDVIRMISERTSPTFDVFTYVPGSATRGTVVYLGGHSYSGTDGDFEIAGSRLVLNTLFNLGSACVANSGVPCSTGLPGVCGTGHYACSGSTPDPICVPDVQPGQRAEICNGLDDNCDGQVDEGLQISCYDPPSGYVDPLNRLPAHPDAFMASSVAGVCHAGISVCQRNADGRYAMSACTGAVFPAAEACNGLDDDCNGTIDDPESLPTIACYDGPPTTLNVGICRPGGQVCHNGQWGGYNNGVFTPGYCSGEVLPKAENCSDTGPGQTAQDDDCNGVVNNGCTCTVGQTQYCFSGPGTAGLGICGRGVQTCQTGGFWGVCEGQVVAQTTPEACVPASDWNADPSLIPTHYDTNCDGRYARCAECAAGQIAACRLEDLPPEAATWQFGAPSQCTYGTHTCKADGTWGACTGYVRPATDGAGKPIEYCDGIDNDCNGTPDDNAICPAGQACLNGVCVQQYCGTERPPPEGYDCQSGLVRQGSCGTSGTCGTGELCQYGNCVDPCPATTVNGKAVSSICASGTVCGGGACIAGGCYESGCGSGLLCLNGACVADPCQGKACPSGTFCRQGDCVQACAFVTCAAGQKCGIDGFCETDPCAGKTCPAGQRCTAGACAADPCLGKGCAAGQMCQGQSGVAVCVDDPCTGVVCPAGICASGQCFSSANPTGAGKAATTTSSKSSGGCGCGSGSGVALPGLLALLAAPFARRRRRPAGGGRGTLLLVLALVAVSATACKSKKTATQFDPSQCKATCEGEQRCIDISSDPSHCGPTVAYACNHACNAGEQCVDGACGPTSLVAPHIGSIAPTTGVKDNPNLAVALSGERFAQGIDLRVTVGSATRTVPCETAACAGAPCCQWLSTSALSAHLDLTDASPTVPWVLRAVNPDGVISNSLSLTVQIPQPSGISVTPSQIPAGTSTTLVVSGSGFTGGSQILLTPTVGALPTTFDPATGKLSCPLDGTSLAAGDYTLTVVSEPDALGRTSSATAPFKVLQSDPVIYSVDPGFVDPGGGTTVASFLVTGLRFDTASATVLMFQGTPGSPLPAGNVNVVGPSAIYVHDLQVGAGTPYLVNNTFTVEVRNAATGRTSNGVTFTVGAQSAARSVTSFNASPAPTYQGQSVALTFNGTQFPDPSQIEVEPPGANTFTKLGTTTVTGGTVATGTLNLVGQPAGQWYVRLRFGTADTDPTSTAWPLRVLSNQVILQNYAASPDPAQAGTVGGAKQSFVFNVSNIRATTVTVSLVDPGGATKQTWPVTTTVDAPTLTIAGTPALDLTGYATGTYKFTVTNPNGDPSNGLNFAVNAGYPSLTSVCLAGTSCQRWAVRGQPVTIKLSGTNFASADVNGNGSVVMAAADFSQNWAAMDPCGPATTTGTQFALVPGTATVVSPTEIDVAVDTLSAYVDPQWGTTYYVGVWNPGGVAGLQKSSCGVDPRTLPWFRLCARSSGTTCTQ